MLHLTTSDGTAVEVSGPLDRALPLVVLLHGLSGDAAHMTDPNAAPSLSELIFDRTSGPPRLVDRGWHDTPGIGLHGIGCDPPATVGSWRAALNAAGFATLSYSQVAPRGELAPNARQLQRIVDEILNADPRLRRLQLVFLAHSRGGILARQILVDNAGDPRFIARVAALISLHTPHQGSGLAPIAVQVNAALLALETILVAAGHVALGCLAELRDEVNSPAYPEISPQSRLLRALAAAEPVPGVEYHTFGGTSTWFRRLWVDIFTPQSAAVVQGRFRWSTMSIPAGVVFDALSFPPLPLPVPLVHQLQVALLALTVLTPELRNGAGDLLVADTAAHLPFSTTRTTNALNHAEALYDPGLHAQVIDLLGRFRGRSSAIVGPSAHLLLS